MKVKAELSIKDATLGSTELWLYIKFKQPNKIFRKRIKKKLEDTWWTNRYKNELEFYRHCLSWFEDEDTLRLQVTDVIKRHLGITEEDIEIEKIIRKINKTKTFEFDIDID